MANEPTRRDALEQQQEELSLLPKELVARFAEMAMVLPETESDGGASIIEAILAASDVHELDKPWDGKDPDELLNRWLVFTGATRSVSDYQGGLGIFLVVEAVDGTTGEEMTFTTGSTSIVAQLVRAYLVDGLPLRAKIVRADKPTRKGYWPTHLVVHENQPIQAAPGA